MGISQYPVYWVLKKTLEKDLQGLLKLCEGFWSFLDHRTRFTAERNKNFSTNKYTIMAVLSQLSVTTCTQNNINL